MELEAQIELLRDNKRKYQNVIKLTQTLANQLSQIIQTQRQLGDAFADLSLKSPELHVSAVVFTQFSLHGGGAELNRILKDIFRKKKTFLKLF